jgi:phosphoserine phosphatase RsbU/P
MRVRVRTLPNLDEPTSILDLTHDPATLAMLEMLRELTAADSTRDTMAAFLDKFRKVRPVDFYMGLVPEAGEPGAFRIAYAMGKRELDGEIVHVPADIARPTGEGKPVHRGGLLSRILCGAVPTCVSRFHHRDDAVFRFVPQDMRSFIALPIMEGARITQWTLSFSRLEILEKRPDDLIRACIIANLLGVANRGFDALAEVRRLSTQLRGQVDGVARVQQALLPNILPVIPGITIATSYLPSDEAGGDFFGFQEFGALRAWAFMIADVSGHGAAAATVTALATGVLMAYADLATSLGRHDLLHPAAIAAFANRALVGVDIDSCFATAIFFVYEPESGRLQYSNSGHNPPRIWRARTRTIESLDDAGSPPLGIIDPHMPLEAAVVLEQGDVLMLYTDGIVELFDPQHKEQFGLSALDAALCEACEQHDGDPHAVIGLIHDRLYAFRKAPTRDDDQTLIVMRRAAR